MAKRARRKGKRRRAKRKKVKKKKVKTSRDINDIYKDLQKQGVVEFITFHPSYSYEEFIEGITIKHQATSTSLDYMAKDGVFKRFCSRALAYAMGESDWQEYGKDLQSYDAYNKKHNWFSIYSKYKDEIQGDPNRNGQIRNCKQNFLLIIDEINRGDISKIFGELITLIEKDKRLGEKEEKIARLTYTSQEFGVPPNVYILGTMNTADRSIALLDTALRRRFGFSEVIPDLVRIRKDFQVKKGDRANALAASCDKIEIINSKICETPVLGRDKRIGHSYFYQLKKTETNSWKLLLDIWRYEIFPLIEEYCWGDLKLLQDITGKDIIDKDNHNLNRNTVAIKSWLTTS